MALVTWKYAFPVEGIFMEPLRNHHKNERLHLYSHDSFDITICPRDMASER